MRAPWRPLLLSVLIGCAGGGGPTALRGPYLGQEPPGEAAEVFAPGIVSTDADEVMFRVLSDGSLILFERTPTDFDRDWIHAPIFGARSEDGVWSRPRGLGGLDLYRSIPDESQYRAVENLGESINTAFNDHDPFIAPDESYLLPCSDRPGGYGRNDLFVAFRVLDGSWARPVNLGEGINTAADETRPYVTPDGKLLFFNSNRSGSQDILWVDAGILDSIRPDDLSRRHRLDDERRDRLEGGRP